MYLTYVYMSTAELYVNLQLYICIEDRYGVRGIKIGICIHLSRPGIPSSFTTIINVVVILGEMSAPM